MRLSLRCSCVTTETPPDVTQITTDQEALALLHDVVTRLAAIETSAARPCGHPGTLGEGSDREQGADVRLR